MARKRKKSKKKRGKPGKGVKTPRRKAASEPVETAEGPDELGSGDDAASVAVEDEVTVIDLDVVTADDEVTVIDLDEATADDEVTVVEVDLDEGLSDADAREQLIAAAAALDASPHDTSAAPSADDGPTDPTAVPPLAVTDADSHAVATDTGAAEGDLTTAGQRGDPDPAGRAPKISSDALVALSQMHAEGLASMAGELILDLGEDSTPEDRDRLLAAALAHSEMQEAIYRVRTDARALQWWKGGVAAALLLVATLIAVRPPGFVTPPAPATLSQADREYGVRVALLLQAQQVEAFRTREQRLPDALTEVPVIIPGVRFVTAGNRVYQLVAPGPDGRALIYDSASPAPEFDEIRGNWITTRDSS